MRDKKIQIIYPGVGETAVKAVAACVVIFLLAGLMNTLDEAIFLMFAGVAL